MRERMVILLCALLGYPSMVVSLLVHQEREPRSVIGTWSRPAVAKSEGGSDYRPSWSSSNDRPLYDATNYTFPDTQTPSGIAQVLEVSFVHGCMQLAKGYVDVLKMFIAASVAAYECGFSLSSIEQELLLCTTETANRPLLPEEVTLRRNWYSLVYMTLSAMGHKTNAREALAASAPQELRDTYGEMLEQWRLAYDNETATSLSVEGLMNSCTDTSRMSELEKTVLLQSLRVVTLTPVVVRESMIARGGG